MQASSTACTFLSWMMVIGSERLSSLSTVTELENVEVRTSQYWSWGTPWPTLSFPAVTCSWHTVPPLSSPRCRWTVCPLNAFEAKTRMIVKIAIHPPSQLSTSFLKLQPQYALWPAKIPGLENSHLCPSCCNSLLIGVLASSFVPLESSVDG